MTDRATLIAKLPKAELHLHIEGSFEPELMMQIAERNGIQTAFKTLEEAKAAYAFSNLQEFLDIYYQGMAVLLHKQDFYDLTWAYLERAAADNVRHVEIFFDPQAHTERGVAFATVADGILEALEDGETKLGITSHVIMSFLRHLSEDDGFALLEESKPYHARFIGVGLDSSEIGHPPSKFARLLAKSCACMLARKDRRNMCRKPSSTSALTGSTMGIGPWKTKACCRFCGTRRPR